MGSLSQGLIDQHHRLTGGGGLHGGSGGGACGRGQQQQGVVSDGGGRGNGVRSPSGLPGMAADPGGGGGWTRMMGLPMSQQKSISGLSNCSCLEMEMNNLGDISVEDFVSLNEDAGAPEWLRGSVGGLLGNGSEADGSPLPARAMLRATPQSLAPSSRSSSSRRQQRRRRWIPRRAAPAACERPRKMGGASVPAVRSTRDRRCMFSARPRARQYLRRRSPLRTIRPRRRMAAAAAVAAIVPTITLTVEALLVPPRWRRARRGTSSAYGHMSSGVRRVTTDGEESVTSSMMSASAASATSTHLAGFVDRRCTRDSLEGSSAMSDGRSSGVPRNATSSSDVVSSDGGGSRVGEALAIGPSAGASRSSSPIAGIAGSSGSDPSPNDPSPPEAASAATATPQGSGSSPVRSAANSLPAPMPSHALALSDGGAADQIANGEAEPAASADAPIAQSLKRRRNSGSSDASAVAGSGGSGGVSPNSKSPRQTRAKLR